MSTEVEVEDSQVTSTEEAPAGAPDDPELEQAMLEAATAAMSKSAEEKAAKAEGAKPASTEEEPDAGTTRSQEETPEEERGSRLHRELKAREKVHGALAEIEQQKLQIQSAYSQAEHLIEQAKSMFAQAQAEKARYEQLRSKPLPEALRELGWSADDLIEHQMREKDPQYQAQRQFEERFSKFERALEERDQKIAKLEAIASSYEEQAHEQAVRASHDELLSSLPENSPALKLWPREFILNMAWDVQQKYEAKHRAKPAIKDLCEYIHVEALKALKAAGASLPQESAGRSNAGKSKANGSRGFTQRDASTRRAPIASKSVQDMDEDELDAHLIAVAEEAKAQAKQRVS